jgi:hypothetical protein
MQLTIEPNHEFQTILIFEREGIEFRLDILSEYLRQVKGIYGYLLNKPELFNDITLYDTKNEDQLLTALSRRLLDILEEEGPSKGSITRFYNKDLGASELYISQISKQSPLLITISVVSLALVSALIISGGKLKITPKGIHVELNAIGDGLMKIQEFVQIRKDNTRRKEAAQTLKKEEIELRLTPTDDLRDSIKKLRQALAVSDILSETKDALKVEISKKEKELARRT